MGSEEIELIRTLNDRELAKNKLTGKVVKGEDKHEPKQSTNSTGQTATIDKQPKVREPRARQKSRKSSDRRNTEPERDRKVDVLCASTVELRKNTLNFVPACIPR